MVNYKVGPITCEALLWINATGPREAAEAYAEMLGGVLEWDSADTTIVRVIDDGTGSVSVWRVGRQVVVAYRARPAPQGVSP